MKVFIVFLAGIIGGEARFAINQYLPKIGDFPLATLLVNLVGCFFFAFFVKEFLVRKKVSETWILAIGTGFFGAFTTFSSMILDSYNLLSSGKYGLLILYIFLELVGGLLMILAGLGAARKWVAA